MIDRRLKIRHIQGFVEITRKRSLKRAAEALFLSQPAISKTLAELEAIAGATLLWRDRGGVRLTPQGALFLEYAESALAALQRGIDGLSADARNYARQLAIGALPSVAVRLMPGVVRHLALLLPDTRLVIADGPHGYLTERLRIAELDVLVGRLGDPSMMRGISFTQLYMEHVAFVVRPDHPLLNAADLREIENWPVIMPAAQSAIRPLVERFLAARGIGRLDVRIETVSDAFGRSYTPRSDAVWIISAGVVANDLAQGRLAGLPFDTSLTAGPVGMMTRADQDRSAELRLVHQALDQAVQDLALA